MIHVAIGFDRNYYNPFCALLASLIDLHDRGTLVFHVIPGNTPIPWRENVKNYIEHFNHEIKFYTIDDSRIHSFVTMSTWTSAVYYRLYFPHLISLEISRFIYLDCDMIALKNLTSLNNHELDGKPVGAVWDNYVKTQPLIGINTAGDYFNSGMLLIDARQWREERVSERSKDYLMTFPERIRFVDQCALNAVLVDRWKKLDIQFNVLYTFLPRDGSMKEMVSFIQDKVIIHFTLQRPWSMLCKNRLRFLYAIYLKKSGLQQGSRLTDFSIHNLPAWARLRLTEIYLDSKILKSLWRFFKGFLKT